MNRRGFRDDAPPWSFFLPVTLAVVLGVLIADAIRLAIGAIFVRDSVEAVVPASRPDAPSEEDEDTAPEPAQTQATAPGAVVADSPAQAAPPAQADVPALPGPISAMRDGDARACINGGIAERRPNGWEQGLENDAPVRCTAVSP